MELQPTEKIPRKTKLTSEQKIHRTIIVIWSVVAGLMSLIGIFYLLNEKVIFTPDNVGGTLLYCGLVWLILIIIGVLNTCQWRQQLTTKKNMLLTWAVLALAAVVTLWLANFKSNDFTRYLAEWCRAYRDLGWHEAFRQITQVSNYTPLYNYMLIIFANLWGTQGCLYAIKFSTFIFSLALALVAELLITHLRHGRFDYLHVAIFLILPPVLMEFTAWGQCDVIYTLFALLAFYFALKHQSVPCFISLGLAFAFKLQFLFIVPIIFVLLVIRDENGEKYLDWRWIWLAPFMYVVNLLPMWFGANILDLLMVYLAQAGSTFWFSEGCFNLPYLLFPISYYSASETTLIKVLNWMMSLIGIMITVTMIVLVIRERRRREFTDLDLLRYALLFAMVMVYFMPKMHERYYFIAFALAMVYFFSQDQIRTKLLCTIISGAFSLAFYNYLIACIVNPYHNYLVGGLIVLSYIAGISAMTFAVACLIHPLLHHEKVDHKKPMR